MFIVFLIHVIFLVAGMMIDFQLYLGYFGDYIMRLWSFKKTKNKNLMFSAVPLFSCSTRESWVSVMFCFLLGLDNIILAKVGHLLAVDRWGGSSVSPQPHWHLSKSEAPTRTAFLPLSRGLDSSSPWGLTATRDWGRGVWPASLHCHKVAAEAQLPTGPWWHLGWWCRSADCIALTHPVSPLLGAGGGQLLAGLNDTRDGGKVEWWPTPICSALLGFTDSRWGWMLSSVLDLADTTFWWGALGYCLLLPGTEWNSPTILAGKCVSLTWVRAVGRRSLPPTHPTWLCSNFQGRDVVFPLVFGWSRKSITHVFCCETTIFSVLWLERIGFSWSFYVCAYSESGLEPLAIPCPGYVGGQEEPRELTGVSLKSRGLQAIYALLSTFQNLLKLVGCIMSWDF